MNKGRFVRQARLPKGAFVKTLEEVCEPYAKKAFKDNYMVKYAGKVNINYWDVRKEFNADLGEYIYEVFCPQCNESLITFTLGNKRVPVDVACCTVGDKFYITKQL